MLYVTKDKQFVEDGNIYVKDLYFPDVGTFIRLNTDLAKNDIRTLRKLAKGLKIHRYSVFNKKLLIHEINNNIVFL
jgi:hypothetical protein